MKKLFFLQRSHWIWQRIDDSVYGGDSHINSRREATENGMGKVNNLGYFNGKQTHGSF